MSADKNTTMCIWVLEAGGTEVTRDPRQQPVGLKGTSCCVKGFVLWPSEVIAETQGAGAAVPRLPRMEPTSGMLCGRLGSNMAVAFPGV